MKLSELAAEAAEHFTTATRDDGTEYVKTTDECPEWIRDLVRDAHGDMFPDDWRYQAIRDVLLSVSDSDAEDEDDLGEARQEIIDGLVDVYTSDLTGWLHSHLRRVAYVDEAAEDFGEEGDTFKRLSMGQYVEYREIMDSMVRSLSDELESREEDEEATDDPEEA